MAEDVKVKQLDEWNEIARGYAQRKLEQLINEGNVEGILEWWGRLHYLYGPLVMGEMVKWTLCAMVSRMRDAK